MQIDRPEVSIMSIRQGTRVRIIGDHPHNGCEGFVIRAEMPPLSHYLMYRVQLCECRHGSSGCYVDSRDVTIVNEAAGE